MPTALLLEDEPLLRASLKAALLRLWPELEIVCETGDGDEAVTHLMRELPDVAFLDLRVPGSSGLDIARRFAPRLNVVFVTAHDEHAIEAFERGAVDYVLKPLQLARLAGTVQRLRERLANLPPGRAAVAPAAPADSADAASAPRQPLRWLQASVGTQTKLVPVGEVLYLQSDHRYTRVVRAHDEMLIRTSLAELTELLDSGRFWQIHRSTLVNIDHVDAVVRDAFGSLELVLKGRAERLQVSRARRHLFKGM